MSSDGCFTRSHCPRMSRVTSPRYVIITPVRNEEEYLNFAVTSVSNQTIQPVEWMLVDDGSTDSTGKIIDECTRRLPWIRAIHRPDRGFRKSGGGVMEAFYDGYNSLTCKDWDFIVKLDGDVSFSADYFEQCFDRFRSDSRLGIAGGSLFHIINGKKDFERGPSFHVRGATKIYRKACWRDIGGLWPAPGWDTIDEVRANMLGWSTRTLPDIQLIHHRQTGTADGKWADSVKHGLVCYISGYHPLFVAASCAYRLFMRLNIKGAVGMSFGFLKAYLTNTPRFNDKEYVAYIREQQRKRLFGGETIWR